MQQSAIIDDLGVSPSFNCYSDDSLTSTAAAATKVSREVKEELQAAGFHHLSDVDEEDFEFSLEFDGKEFSGKELALDGRMLFPIFNSDLVTKDEVGQDDSSLAIPLENLFLGDSDESLYSSSDSEDKLPSGSFRVTWRKGDDGSPTPADYKKSKSTGSDSIKGKLKDILRRSNSAGKETVYFFCPIKVAACTKQKRIVNSGETPKVARKSKKESSRSVHELFYVQKRAERKGDKMKSYLPYRQEILGFYVNVKGNSNKKLPF